MKNVSSFGCLYNIYIAKKFLTLTTLFLFISNRFKQLGLELQKFQQHLGLKHPFNYYYLAFSTDES